MQRIVVSNVGQTPPGCQLDCSGDFSPFHAGLPRSPAGCLIKIRAGATHISYERQTPRPTSTFSGNNGCGKSMPTGLHRGRSFLGFGFSSLPRPVTSSAASLAGFSGLFPVRFFHRNVFSTTSPLRFPVRFRFVCGYPCSPCLYFQQLLRFVFKNNIFFVPQFKAKQIGFL